MKIEGFVTSHLSILRARECQRNLKMPFTRLNTFTIRDSCALDGLLYGIRNDSRTDIEEAIELADLFLLRPIRVISLFRYSSTSC